MAKKKIVMTADAIAQIKASIGDKITYDAATVKADLEEDVDDAVKNKLKDLGYTCIRAKKTGNKTIDSQIPAYHGEKGNGHPDVMLYNYFGDDEIDLIVEDKNFTSTENATEQAITYASVGDKIGKPVRIIVGNSPSKEMDVRVLVKKKYEPLYIDGVQVKTFFGEDILNLIYDYPNFNEFVLEEYVEKPFGQKEFRTVIDNLKQIYRTTVEIGNNDDKSINFTVALIAIKMIAEKEGKKWDKLNTYDDLKAFLDTIIGDTADDELNKKYGDIFKIKDSKSKAVIFNFGSILTTINTRITNENNAHKRAGEAETVNPITTFHRIISVIPEGDTSIDLFGEIYEALASKKTKESLGEYFTRRHIIKAIVNLLLTDDDIENIVKNKEKVGDLFCGTGGFLTEAFKHIKDYCVNTDKNIDISALASEIMVGYDVNPNNVGRTRINMTLAGDGFSDIREQNTLTSTTCATGIKYILTNVPYGVQGTDIICDKNSDDDFIKNNNNKRLELNAVIKVIQVLEKGGKAAVVIPESLLEASSLNDFRSFVLRNCEIMAIISLPKFAFAPYTKTKTDVLLLKKRYNRLDSIDNVNENERIWCYIVDNDGFANSDKRYATNLQFENGMWKHNDLQGYVDDNNILHPSKIEKAFDGQAEDTELSYLNEWNEEIKGKKYGYITVKDVKSKKTVGFAEITKKEAINKIKNLINTNTDGDKYVDFTANLEQNKKGFVIKDSNIVDSDGNIPDAAREVLDDANLDYNVEDNTWYDTSKEVTSYALTMVPEKYFRPKEVKEITIDGLKKEVSDFEANLKSVLGGLAI